MRPLSLELKIILQLAVFRFDAINLISQFVRLVSCKYSSASAVQCIVPGLHLLFILSNPGAGCPRDDHPRLPLSLVFREEVAHLTVAGGHHHHGEEVGQQEEDNVVDIVQC